jgi:hypothetical protein
MEMNVWYKISSDTHVMRVPGGWIYNIDENSSTFVPFVKED